MSTIALTGPGLLLSTIVIEGIQSMNSKSSVLPSSSICTRIWFKTVFSCIQLRMAVVLELAVLALFADGP